MIIFTIILVLFIILIFISMVNTLLYLSLNLVTKKKYKESELVLPSFLSILLWSISYIIIYKIISIKVETNIFSLVIASLFNLDNFRQFIPVIAIPITITLIGALILQSIVLLTVNINYIKIYNSIIYFFKHKCLYIKHKLKKENSFELLSEEKTKNIQIVEENYKLEYINSFVSCLFIFSLLFFWFILLFWIGTLIATKFI